MANLGDNVNRIEGLIKHYLVAWLRGFLVICV